MSSFRGGENKADSPKRRQKNKDEGVDMLMAAKLLDDVMQEQVAVKHDPKSKKSRRKYEHEMNYLRTGMLIALPCLTLFQKPHWCRAGQYSDDCTVFLPTGTKIPTFTLPFLDDFLLVFLEITMMICLIIFKLRKHKFVKMTSERMLRETSMIGVLCITIIIDLIDLVLPLPIQMNMYLRLLFVLLYTNQVRKTASTYMRIFYRSKEMVSILIMNIFFFALVGTVLFEGTKQQEEVFTTYWQTALQLLVLQTTCNYPDVMLRAYKETRLAFFFFATFLVIQYLMLVNMTISYFYCQYSKELEEKRDIFLRQETAQELLRIIAAREKIDKDELEEGVEHILESNADTKAKKATIEKLIPKHPPELTHFPPVIIRTNEKTKIIADFLISQIFDAGLSVLSFLAVVMVILASSSLKKWWRSWGGFVGLGVNILFFIDPVCRIAVFRKDLPTKWFWIYEIVTSFLIICGNAIDLIFEDDIMLEIMTFVMLLRLPRFFRIFKIVPAYRTIFGALVQLMKIFFEILGLLGVIFYLYTVTGMHIFGGRFTMDVNLAEQGFPADYIYDNFNDFTSGFVTMFEFLIVNAWDVQMSVYAFICGTDIVKLYFISFYVFGHILALGILVALTIDVIVSHLTAKKNPITASTSDYHFHISTEKESSDGHRKSMTIRDDINLQGHSATSDGNVKDRPNH